MQRHWMTWMVLAGALAGSLAIEAKEKVTAKILGEAKAKVAHIEGLIASAKMGNAEAQFELGMMIGAEGRKYVTREVEKQHKPDPAAIKTAIEEVDAAALEWLLRAAWQGHDLAQRAVANRYEDTDIVWAYAWNLVRVRKSGRESTSMRGGIERTRTEWMLDEMTPDQVAKAE